MRTASLLPVFTLLFLACTASPRDRLREALRNRAEESYNYLLKGDLGDYVSCLYGYETMHGEYRTQMEDVFAQYLAREKETRGGLTAFTVVGDTMLDSVNAMVFLEITFGDGTKEKITQPMILANDTWALK